MSDARYVMQVDARRGLVRACFSRPDGPLLGFIRSKFHRVFNGRNGICYSYARQTPRGKAYGIPTLLLLANAEPWSRS